MTPERTRLWLVVLAASTAISYGLIRYFAPPEIPPPLLPTARQDNEIRSVEMRVYDETGQPNLVLVSPRITSPRRSDEYLIETPVFDVLSADQTRWKGVSRTGRLDVAKDRLWLMDAVQLDGERKDRLPMRINTERLEFRLDERLAVNDEAVEIHSPGSDLRGVGLQADLKKDHFILRSQVEGEYAPKRSGSPK